MRNPPSLEEYFAEIAKNHRANGFTFPPHPWPMEQDFIRDMRLHARLGVGYGFMMQVLSIEWEHATPGAALGWDFYERKLAEKDARILELEAQLRSKRKTSKRKARKKR